MIDFGLNSMDKRSFKNYVEQELGPIPLFIIYAFLEWILIILLFIDGLLAFVANEFAKFFEMRIPCLLCTRIDHVLVKRDSDFYYNDSICEAHKKETSSLAYCHVHKKLSHIKQMCEGCLLSFATEKESGCDTYKSLVGILHKDLDHFVQDDSQIQLGLHAGRTMQVESDSEQSCACCGATLRVKSTPSNMKVLAKSTSPISNAPAPSPRAHYRGEETLSLTLPHIRYTELKFAPDGESEIPEDDVSMGAIVPENPGAEDLRAASVPLLTESDDMNELNKTPTFSRGNRFFGIPLSDSANNSPRWSIRALRKSPLEKVEFASDAATDGNSTNEADSIVSHLKRQVRIDRKSLIALYMELDEERSASAVAANNAMAMITRLQAEKAAVQMEALQYQRMMEEQAEYDQEALQETNTLLTKREEEIKDLEAELEVYRMKFGILSEDEFQACKDEIDDEVYEDLNRDQFISDNEFDSTRGSSHKEEHAGEAGNREDIMTEKEASHHKESPQDHQECNGDVSQLSEASVLQDNQFSG